MGQALTIKCSVPFVVKHIHEVVWHLWHMWHLWHVWHLWHMLWNGDHLECDWGLWEIGGNILLSWHMEIVLGSENILLGILLEFHGFMSLLEEILEVLVDSMLEIVPGVVLLNSSWVIGEVETHNVRD